MLNLPRDNARRKTQDAPVPYGTGQAKRIGTRLLGIFFLLFALFTIHYSLFPGASFAQKFDTDLGQFQRALGSNNYNKETFDLQSVIGVSGSLYTLLAGCKSGDANCPQALRTGAVDKLGETIAGIYAVPPASGVYYASTIIERLNLVQPAYAQEAGTGFRVLEPFLNVWRAVRNMVYVLFILGAVVLGLMIMFRTRISPQAVMTVQTALPRLLVALLFVTFSYAIVGFLIDLTYVAVGAIMWTFNNANIPGYDAARSFNAYVNAGFGETVWAIFTRGLLGGADLVGQILGGDAAQTVSAALAVAVASTIAVFLPPALLPIIGGAIGVSLIPLLLGLIIAIIAFLLRTLFALARAYLLLLIFLILGPLFILWGALSGGGIWNSWLRGVLANLLVFPAVGLVIFAMYVFIDLINTAPNPWGPPYIGQQQAILRAMIALGGIMLLPNIPDIINQFLGVRAVRIDLPAIGRQFETAMRDITQTLQRTRERGAGTR